MLRRIGFVVCIVGGFLVLLVLPMFVRESFCPPQQLPKTRAVETSAGPTEQHEATEERDGLPTVNEQHAEQHGTDSDANYLKGLLPTFLCEETKVTDWALVFFTYSLVVVGWFTMLSAERTIEATERAYVFPGYYPATLDGGHIKFTMIMTNVGRMPAVIKEVGCKFIDCANPPNPKNVHWIWTKISFDAILPTGTPTKIQELKSHLTGDHLFLAYISYQDIFTKRMCTSRMGMHFSISETGEVLVTRGGGDIWNTWD